MPDADRIEVLAKVASADAAKVAVPAEQRRLDRDDIADA